MQSLLGDLTFQEAYVPLTLKSLTDSAEPHPPHPQRHRLKLKRLRNAPPPKLPHSPKRPHLVRHSSILLSPLHLLRL